MAVRLGSNAYSTRNGHSSIAPPANPAAHRGPEDEREARHSEPHDEREPSALDDADEDQLARGSSSGHD
jgi:hypothetical protein